MADIIDYTGMPADKLYALEADHLLIVQNLRREVDDVPADAIDKLLERERELLAAEDTLYAIQQAIPVAEKRESDARAAADAEATPKTLAPNVTGDPPVTRSGKRRRGPLSTGQEVKAFDSATTLLEMELRVHMPQVPTAVYHLLDPAEDPLISCKLTNNLRRGVRRLLVRAYVERYSAEAVQTVELDASGGTATIKLLPTLFPEAVRDIRSLTRATLHLIVEDIEKEVKIAQHVTEPIWLLARTSAPQAVKDPVSGKWNDLTRYLGAYVTPSAPAVMTFLRNVAQHHPNGRLVGYQAEVESQAMAIYEALQIEKNITYVDSLIDFNPEEKIKSQRVRLPRESLEDCTANCIDGTLLFASLLQGISINPCIVLVPRHAFVGWETAPGNNDWQYLETTMLQTHDFRKALDIGNRRTATYIERFEKTGDDAWFRRWSLRDLRVRGIVPME